MKQIFFAQKALIVKDGKLLMIRKSKNEQPNPLRWDVPGGRMDYGEEIDGSLEREVYEEVGVKAKIGKPYCLGQWFVTRPSKNNDGEPLEMQIVAVYRFCSIKDTKFSTDNNTNSDDIELVEWVPIDDNMLKLDLMAAMIPTIKQLIQDFNAGKLEFSVL